MLYRHDVIKLPGNEIVQWRKRGISKISDLSKDDVSYTIVAVQDDYLDHGGLDIVELLSNVQSVQANNFDVLHAGYPVAVHCR